jgi:signal peptidase II
MRRFKDALLISSIVIALDQITKYLALNYINPYDSIKIFPFLHLVIVLNKGAAFGMFKSIGSGFFIAVSIVAILFVIFLLIKGREDYFGLSLILGGAIGNLIDRVLYGRVMDFIDLSLGKYHWPAFNVADSSLTVGVTLILLIHFLKTIKVKHSARKS